MDNIREELQQEIPAEGSVTSNDFWNEMERNLADLAYREYGIAPAMKLLREGAEAGDPEMMFLWAEFLFWGMLTSDCAGSYIWETMDIFEEEIEIAKTTREWFDYGKISGKALCIFADEDEFWEVWCDHAIAYWYQEAAKAGYVPAMCWLGWCAMRGLGMEKDEEKSHYWFDMAKKYPKVSDFLHPRLEMFIRIGAALAEESRELDLQEDIDCDMGYGSVSYPWREVFAASLMAYKVGCQFGNPECALSEYIVEAYDYADCYSSERSRMSMEKRMWQIWCAIHGVGLGQVSTKTLWSWWIDIDTAIQDKRLDLDAQTEELLHELTGAILRL